MKQTKRLINFIKFRRRIYQNNIKHFNEIRDAFIIKNIQGNKMLLNIKDMGLHYDLIANEVREPQSTQVIKELINNDDVAVDIGANVGYYTLLMKKAKRVYALEPSSKNYANLMNNVLLNKCKNVILMKKAIGNANGYAYLNLSERGNLNTIRNTNKKFIGKERVAVITFDDFAKQIEDNPTFVRMDVEGYEYQIIKGMKEYLKKSFKLFIELHPHIMAREETLEVLNTLRENNFDILAMFRSYTVPEMPFKNDIIWNYKIDQLINDEQIISGKKGAFEIFFYKTQNHNETN